MKLISLNIELNKHYDTVIPFLNKEKADVICLQEVCKEDLPFLEKELKYKHIFYTPMTLVSNNNIIRTSGHAIITSHPANLLQTNYYYTLYEDETKLPLFDKRATGKTINKALTIVEVSVDNTQFIVGNTHFTWTEGGLVDDNQLKDMPKLLEIAAKQKDIILCGDFNAPRGRGSWTALCERYTDNIPPHITNTLDPTHHRVPALRYVVDGIFTSSGYRANNIEVRCGISDHCAIIGEITKNT